jgi:hypothetical protein
VYETTGASYRQISPYKSQLFRSLSVCFPLVFGIRDARPRPSLTLYSTVVATKLMVHMSRVRACRWRKDARWRRRTRWRRWCTRSSPTPRAHAADDDDDDGQPGRTGDGKSGPWWRRAGTTMHVHDERGRGGEERTMMAGWPGGRATRGGHAYVER